MPVGKERAAHIAMLAEEMGRKAAAESLGITTESVRRAIGVHRNAQGIESFEAAPEEKPSSILQKFAERFTDAELRAILNGSVHTNERHKKVHEFDADSIKVGLLTDTHLGSSFTDTDNLQEAFDVFSAEDVDFVAHCGDVFEGMSGRPGHIYECTHLGYSAQLDHGRDMFGMWTNTPVYMIDGNHDRWFRKSSGANIVKELCDGQDNLHFIGHDEGDIELRASGLDTPANIKLWHGEDGSSYAISYRVQKIVESFTGGEKPHAFFCGHTHKSMYVFDRHVHCISCGSMQKQSNWMRSKKHASHTGFWVVELGVNAKGIAWCSPRWYPFYV